MSHHHTALTAVACVVVAVAFVVPGLYFMFNGESELGRSMVLIYIGLMLLAGRLFRCSTEELRRGGRK